MLIADAQYPGFRMHFVLYNKSSAGLNTGFYIIHLPYNGLEKGPFMTASVFSPPQRDMVVMGGGGGEWAVVVYLTFTLVPRLRTFSGGRSCQ